MNFYQTEDTKTVILHWPSHGLGNEEGKDVRLIIAIPIKFPVGED